jgi:hypothetical protein
MLGVVFVAADVGVLIFRKRLILYFVAVSIGGKLLVVCWYCWELVVLDFSN